MLEMADTKPRVLGADLPDGASFVSPGEAPAWRPGRAVPAANDLDACVACGLCLPHCPTYRLTGEESQSPRGRIAAIRAVQDGLSKPDKRFASFMDACLVCRACEDVCPSHVEFGRMMEAAREQVEPRRGSVSRLMRWIGFHWILPHPSLIRSAAALQPVARPLMPARVRRLMRRRAHPFARLPRETKPTGPERGTVALLAGCAQDRWFHEVNLATIRVLAGNGFRVKVPRGQACCGALAAHNGRLAVARRLARRARHAFADAEVVLVNAAGCSAHMLTYDELEPGTGLPVQDVLVFLNDRGLATELSALDETVAYHDACHASRAQGIRAEPRALLANIPGLRLVEVRDGERCCGAAGIYNLTQPGAAAALGEQKAAAIRATGATVVASANPGCTTQLEAHLGVGFEVVHPIELIDRALRGTRI
jgi:glycolate oxidase iron-sulfur subunit